MFHYFVSVFLIEYFSKISALGLFNLDNKAGEIWTTKLEKLSSVHVLQHKNKKNKFLDWLYFYISVTKSLRTNHYSTSYSRDHRDAATCREVRMRSWEFIIFTILQHVGAINISIIVRPGSGSYYR